MMTPEQAQKKREYDEGLTNLLDTLPRLTAGRFRRLVRLLLSLRR